MMTEQPFVCDWCGAEIKDRIEYIDHVSEELAETSHQEAPWPAPH